VVDIEETWREAIVAWNANDRQTLERLSDPEATIKAPKNWPAAGEFEGGPASARAAL
jgi:hypothetical protein